MKSFPTHPLARRIATLGASLMLAVGSLVVFAPAANAEIDVYTTPGQHMVNARKWRTNCETYSQTYRCFTYIWATQVTQVKGKFVPKTDWYFNNLTYASSPRSLWAGNPLAANGVVGGTLTWTAADGRKWRTECDTAITGGGGCRSWIWANEIESYKNSKGKTAFRWVTHWVFNNMVRFGPLPVFKVLNEGQTASLAYFDVKVISQEMDADGTAKGAKVQVCYTHPSPDADSDGKVRVSRDPWFVGLVFPEIDADLTKSHFYSVNIFSVSSALTPVYVEKKLALGDCQLGYLLVHDGNPDAGINAMMYAPSTSPDRIIWKFPV